MKPVIVIPARRGSTRLPDKMLIDIRGKPLIRWTVEAAMRTGLPIYVATDDDEIIAAVADLVGKGCGWVRTGPCLNGTERCIEAIRRVGGTDYDLLINWQGDSPLTSPSWVQRLVEFMERSRAAVGTLHCRVDREALDGEVEVMMLPESGAASFARKARGNPIEYRHIGLYAIKEAAWDLYGRVPSHLELALDLEQKRWLDRGVAITSVEVTESSPAIEINTAVDVGLFKTVLESIG